jgi:hypothetical protein
MSYDYRIYGGMMFIGLYMALEAQNQLDTRIAVIAE